MCVLCECVRASVRGGCERGGHSDMVVCAWVEETDPPRVLPQLGRNNGQELHIVLCVCAIVRGVREGDTETRDYLANRGECGRRDVAIGTRS